MIADLCAGENADGIYLVKESQSLISANGNNYLNVVLQDKTGTIDAKKWEITTNDVETFKPGNFVFVYAEANLYKDKLQLVIKSSRLLKQSDINLGDFIPEAPVPFEDLKQSLRYYIDSINNEDAKKIVKKIINDNVDKFLNHPAAVRNHHETLHGLLYHTISMCKVAESLCALYTDLDKDILISGCILHDVGKIIELSGIIGCYYTTEGELLGHLSIGAGMINEVAKELNIEGETVLLLEHMVLSHHGKPEFGACVQPKTKEALVLNMIDDLDAKLNTLNKCLAKVEEGEFTEKIFALDNRTFYKPKK